MKHKSKPKKVRRSKEFGTTTAATSGPIATGDQRSPFAETLLVDAQNLSPSGNYWVSGRLIEAAKEIERLTRQHDAWRQNFNTLANERSELLEALRSVVGHGYCEQTSVAASQDYVSKKAIAKVRAAIRKAEGKTP